MESLSGLMMLINLERLSTAAALTSFSTSLRIVVNIYIKDKSVISFPKASAIFIYLVFYRKKSTSAKFLASANLTLQDLSSVAAMITKRVSII
jgi:hypothetical protein